MVIMVVMLIIIHSDVTQLTLISHSANTLIIQTVIIIGISLVQSATHQ